MAIINCHECNKEISDLAASCPHCGAFATNTWRYGFRKSKRFWEPPATYESMQPQKRSNSFLCFLLASLILFGLLALAANLAPHSQPTACNNSHRSYFLTIVVGAIQSCVSGSDESCWLLSKELFPPRLFAKWRCLDERAVVSSFGF